MTVPAATLVLPEGAAAAAPSLLDVEGSPGDLLDAVSIHYSIAWSPMATVWFNAVSVASGSPTP